MVNLYATTPELWPEQARRILTSKGISIEFLQQSFQEVIFPWCHSYNYYRIFYESQNIETPLFIIVVHTHDESRKALDLLQIYSLTTRIINGRHSTVIMNPDFYIDVSALKKICLLKNGDIRVQGGATQGQVYKFLFQHCHSRHTVGLCKILHYNSFHNIFHPQENMAFPGGSQGSVGVTGVTTNGGLGSFKRTLGLAIDYVESIRLVVPPTKTESSSRVLVCTSKENADLFWALCGCVALNFGLVLDIVYRPAVLTSILLYFLTFSWDDAVQVISLWQRDAPTRPFFFNEDLNTYAYKKGTHSEKGISISGQYVIPEGQSVHDAKLYVTQTLAPFVRLSTSFEMAFQTYEDTIKGLSEGRVYFPFSLQSGILSSLLIDPVVIVRHVEKGIHIEGLHYYLLELLGGKISSKTSHETAFYPRDAKIWYDVSTFYTSVVDSWANENWFQEAFGFTYHPNTLQNTVFAGLPRNNLANHREAYYGTNVERLMSIKEKYDPLHLLRFPSGLVQ